MIESSETFSVIGTVFTKDQNEVILEIDNQKQVSFRNMSRLRQIARDNGRETVTDFISRTIISTSIPEGTLTLAFDSDEAKKCQEFLQQQFAGKDESVLRFFELLESNLCSDINKFANCIKIIHRQEVQILKPEVAFGAKFFLVIGLFDEPVGYTPFERIFLQKFEQLVETNITHEELSMDLYQFAQLSRVKKFIERTSQIRGY